VVVIDFSIFKTANRKITTAAQKSKIDASRPRWPVEEAPNQPNVKVIKIEMGRVRWVIFKLLEDLKTQAPGDSDFFPGVSLVTEFS